jgi:hypothetical protein
VLSESAPTTRATLEVALEADAPAGTLTAPDGRRRSFSGWLELASAIEDWRATARSACHGEEERP